MSPYIFWPRYNSRLLQTFAIIHWPLSAVDAVMTDLPKNKTKNLGYRLQTGARVDNSITKLRNRTFAWANKWLSYSEG